MKTILFLLISIPGLLLSQSMTGTYEFADIPTSLDLFDSSCNGPVTTLEFTLPGGGLWQVTGIDIEYSMTAQGGGWKSQQRSQIHFQNANTTEPTVYEGIGNTGGIQSYSRTGISIANGMYPGNTNLVFEMRCWRAFGGSGCNTTYNKVNNFTWIMTVYYQSVPEDGRVGIGTDAPETSALLELRSIQKGFLPPRMTTIFRDGISDPAEGLTIYCTDCVPAGIYVFNGSVWTGGHDSKLDDGDGDTRITVEQNPDEDKIRLTTAGSERMIIETDGDVGIATATPQAKLDVDGKIKIGDDGNASQAGMMRWNDTINDFEGFNGDAWVSLTRQQTQGQWGEHSVTQSDAGLASDGTFNNFFGKAVSITNSHAIAGAGDATVNGNFAQGKAYIFSHTGNEWSEMDILIASDGVEGDFFGESVAITENHAIVGSASHDTGGNFAQGKAYIFANDGTDWPQEDILINSDGGEFDFFGWSVSISGNYAIVGALGHENLNANIQGKAYIYYYDGVDWIEQAGLIASDTDEGFEFGSSVAISGDYAIVGAKGVQPGQNYDQGKAYIFIRSGSTWSQQAILEASDGEALDLFGGSVAISGDYCVVGAMDHDTEGNQDRGKAYVFKRNGSTWSQQSFLIASDGAANDHFGKSVSIHQDYVLVGANDHSTSGDTGRGKAYIFKRTGNAWHEQNRLIASDGSALDSFGTQVSLSEDFGIVGSPNFKEGVNPLQGKIYFFRKN